MKVEHHSLDPEARSIVERCELFDKQRVSLHPNQHHQPIIRLLRMPSVSTLVEGVVSRADDSHALNVSSISSITLVTAIVCLVWYTAVCVVCIVGFTQL